MISGLFQFSKEIGTKSIDSENPSDADNKFRVVLRKTQRSFASQRKDNKN